MGSTLLMFALTIGAPGLKDPPKQSILGEWHLESRIMDGAPTPPFRSGSLYFEFKFNGTCVRSRGVGIPPSVQHFDIDLKADPPTITMRGMGSGQSSSIGIWKVDGDTLTLCLDRSGTNARPKSFESPVGSKITLYVFKRMKKE
jgi:uncharacterized protein (TIGR03067 family)